MRKCMKKSTQSVMDFFVLSFQVHSSKGSAADIFGKNPSIIYSFFTGKSIQDVTSRYKDAYIFKESKSIEKIIFLGATQIFDTHVLLLLNEVTNAR